MKKLLGKLKLHKDWKKIVRHSWSMRLMVGAAFLSGLQLALPYLAALPIPATLFSVLGAVVMILAPIARVLAQGTLSGDDDK